MKYLSQYIEAEQTKAFNKAGAFFAFSNKQFDEAKKEGVKYTNMYAGLICPKDNATALDKELTEIAQRGRLADVAENGMEAVVLRELNNYECYYTGNTEDAERNLADYPVTVEDIRKLFHNQNYKIKDAELIGYPITKEPEASRLWECTICGHTTGWSYDELASSGTPQCPKCDDDMSLTT